MDSPEIAILLRLIIAHLLADFVFQTNGMVKGKREKGPRSSQFRWHLVIVAVLTYLFIADWANWWAPMAMAIAHGIIDWIKISIKKDNMWIYLGDQFAHFISIILLWMLLIPKPFAAMIDLSSFEFHSTFLIIAIAYIIVALPSGVLIGYLTKSWQEQLSDKQNQESLKDAGKWIGIIERLLILTFIIFNQWEPIGFLLAAKSVFRFGDLKKGKEQKKTEYILIGTLLSFTLAIFIGLLVQLMIN
ncbi:hypothetical protein AWW67_07710 [Roseivirga seohaensis]|uniref:DUF3307 domain-containing protein n=1 Tax=Roseivirga seohaensis TaxID=1914963 RepID=A0A150XRB2_9BACT|nr:DUF3307 domain-containing protein [Roseivirga seohaensis]KYG81234.1 hypothetical protein AWW67_07710 [Roseivirga seohaensis]